MAECTDADLELAKKLIANWHIRGDVALLGTDACLAQALADAREEAVAATIERCAVECERPAASLEAHGRSGQILAAAIALHIRALKGGAK